MGIDLKALLKARADELIAMPRDKFIAHLRSQDADEFTQMLRYASFDLWAGRAQESYLDWQGEGIISGKTSLDGLLCAAGMNAYNFVDLSFSMPQLVEPISVLEESCLTPLAA